MKMNCESHNLSPEEYRRMHLAAGLEPHLFILGDQLVQACRDELVTKNLAAEFPDAAELIADLDRELAYRLGTCEMDGYTPSGDSELYWHCEEPAVEDWNGSRFCAFHVEQLEH
jgi:hypothetical protein